jgi:hypothetical protein
LSKRGHKKAVWVLAFREDCTQPDGSFKRTQRKVVLGLVRTMNKSEAYTVAQPDLEAVNLTVASGSKAGKTLRSFVAEWELSVAPTLKPSTVRAAKSHLRAHILPALGELSLSAITTRNVQAFASTLAAKELTRKSCENVSQTLNALTQIPVIVCRFAHAGRVGEAFRKVPREPKLSRQCKRSSFLQFQEKADAARQSCVQAARHFHRTWD